MRLQASFPAEPPAIRTIRAEVAAVARACGLGEREIADVALAVSEAATNAIVHGYREGEGVIHVYAAPEGGELRVEIRDQGTGPVPRRDSPGLGLGLPIIASVAKCVEVGVAEGGGTRVHMTFPCPASEVAA